MEKGKGGRLVLFATQALCAFLLLHLMYVQLFALKDTQPKQIKFTGRQILSELKADLSNVVKNDDRKQSLQYLLSRLVGGEDRSKLDSTGFACDNGSWSLNPPVLLLISRQTTRKFLNQQEMVKMMEELGFRVIIASSAKEMSNVEKFSRVINSCSVMVGAHGAGLANEIFLPDGAVMVQVRPLGFQWDVDSFYSEPGPNMGLKFLEYRIEPEESSLADVYGLDHPVLRDTASVAAKGGYEAAREMYLDKQDLRIDLNRFRETLIEALRIVGRRRIDVANA
ncbi:hypothetical protein L2E82_37866 [Cichorium intybus]|uniref:Uncharacterized protein n=1 Tax=Cichorium intybus TaxID=13427 RepID=A0ACB9AF65_CICIN|nr:hypothetical protein L2E82_37866 [Cichorium intybus]